MVCRTVGGRGVSSWTLVFVDSGNLCTFPRSGEGRLSYREGADGVEGVELQPLGHVDCDTRLHEAV